MSPFWVFQLKNSGQLLLKKTSMLFKLLYVYIAKISYVFSCMGHFLHGGRVMGTCSDARWYVLLIYNVNKFSALSF